MNNKQKKLSELMRSKRFELDITQEQAAELLDISARWLQKVESGQSKPGFDLICKLAKEFDINFAELAEIDEKIS